MNLPATFDGLVQRRAVRRWQKIAAAAPALDAPSLRVLGGEARALRRTLDAVIAAGEEIEAAPGRRLDWISEADWCWRPGLWDHPQTPADLVSPESGAALGYDLKVFHDEKRPDILLRQTRATPPEIELEVFGLSGSFLSLVLDLPPERVQGLDRHHILRMAGLATFERATGLQARLNLRYGPNTEQLVSPMEIRGDDLSAEFDLGYVRPQSAAIDAAWIDLILDAPRMTRIVVSDLLVSRHLRADL